MLKQHLSIPINDKKILIVDDISDSGQTLKTAKHHLIEKGATETKTATLYTKPVTKTRPDFTEKITHHWIVFPWEIKETIQNILQQQKDKQTTINTEFAKLIKAGLPKHLIKQIIKTIPDAQQLDTTLL
jgi:hypoxanthine phosphoribosyltransferase